MSRSDYDPRVTPIDRIRWPAVFAGLFSAMSFLVVLAVLGAAIGMSAYDRSDSPRVFAIGAGWWAAISALVAFAFGGWVAARTSAVRGVNGGLINGAMVWAVAVPLSLLLFTGGLSSLAGTAASTAATASNVNMQRHGTQQFDQSIADQARQAGADIQAQMNDPQRMEEISRTGARTAWGTLASLVLGLLAATFGGYLGTRGEDVAVPRGGPTATA